MRRTTALLVPLALALVVGSLTAATGAQPVPGDGQSPLVASYANESNYLTIPADEVRATDSQTVGLDVGTATGIDGRNLQASYRMETFRERFGDASSDAERTSAFDSIVTALERRTGELQARNDRVIGAYGDGTITAGTLLRERAAINAEARRLDASIAELRAVERDSLNYAMSDDLQGRLGNLSGRLQSLRGPISERTAQLAGGGGQPESVYVEGSADGYVFATVDDDAYVREAYLGDEYDPGATDQFADADSTPVEQALQRAGVLYPNSSLEGIGGFGSTNIYQYNADVPAGQITVYLDGGTTNAFLESQRVNASALPVSDTRATTTGSIALRVNRTFATGPMEVALVDTSTGDPIDGTVVVDGEVIGRTGADGSRWTIEPRDGARVTAATAETNLTVSVPGA